MAKQHTGPTPRHTVPEGPAWYPAWREEFNSRSAWGRHPAADARPQREWLIGDKGPSPKQGHHVEHHPGDD